MESLTSVTDTSVSMSNVANLNFSNADRMMALEEQLVSIPEDSLTAIVRYHLIEGGGQISGRQELLKQFALMLVAISGAGLYATAADAYAKSEQASLAGRINFMVSTCVPALVVLYNSTELFLRMRAAEHIPKKLANYLADPYTPTQKIVQNTAITLGSAISALPLAAVSFMYPIPGFSKSLMILQGIIVEIDNTILHFLPIKLALKNPLFRLPSLPVEYIYHAIVNCTKRVEEKREKQLQEQRNRHYQTIKQYFIDHLTRTQKLLAIYGFSFNGKIKYDNDVAFEIKALQDQKLQPLALLEQLLQRINAMAPNQPVTKPGLINRCFNDLAGILGALWVTSSCAGYLAAPVNELSELSGSNLMGASFAAPSIYFLGVLLVFFGKNSGQAMYEYFTSWNSNSVKIPLEFKLYPKIALLLIVMSMYISFFSYAAAAELIEDNFTGKLEFLRPPLLVLAKTGLAFLGFTAMLDFVCNMLRKCAQYSGKEHNEIVIKLTEAFDQFKNSIQLMQPVCLLESLARLSEEQLVSLLNLRGQSDKQGLINTIEQLQQSGDNSPALQQLLHTVNHLAVDVQKTDGSSIDNLVISETAPLIPSNNIVSSRNPYGIFAPHRNLEDSSSLSTSLLRSGQTMGI